MAVLPAVLPLVLSASPAAAPGGITAVSPTSGRLDVGDAWLLAVEVRDVVTGLLTDATVTAVATRPDASTSTLTVTRQALGYYTAAYILAATGRHTAAVTSAGAVVGVELFAVDALAVSSLPDLADLKQYLNSTGSTSFADADLSAALAAEQAAQASVCAVPAVYPADLREALFRRVARNLAARAVPISSYSSFESGGVAPRVPKTDPEVARLEAPYKRLVVA